MALSEDVDRVERQTAERRRQVEEIERALKATRRAEQKVTRAFEAEVSKALKEETEHKRELRELESVAKGFTDLCVDEVSLVIQELKKAAKEYAVQKKDPENQRRQKEETDAAGVVSQLQVALAKKRTEKAIEAKELTRKDAEQVERAKKEARKKDLERELEELSKASSTSRSSSALPKESNVDTGKSSTVDAVAVAQAPVKGKGKGMPKSAPPPPKAPPPKAAQPPKMPERKTNPYVVIHWKAIAEYPDPPTAPYEKLTKFFHGENASTQEVAKRHRHELGLPARDAYVMNFMETGSSQPRRYAFDPCSSQNRFPPQSYLDAHHRKRTAVFKLDTCQVQNPADSALKALIDDKRLQMLGILLRKHIMAHKGETEHQAVFSLKRAVLLCDERVVRQEGLSVLRTVLRAHAAEGNKVTEFVREHGEAALDKLQHPIHHKLIYELLKVPQIDERLECMLFQSAFEESKGKCIQGLEVLCAGLRLISLKKNLLGKLFVTAHRLGLGLNFESRLEKTATKGFQLAAFDTFMKIKIPASPKHNLLHFILAMMRKEDVDALFTADDIKILAKAKTFRTYPIYQDCLELVQGYFGVREICKSGNYISRTTGAAVKIERRRKTMCPGSRDSNEQEDAAIDSDDRFHEVMKRFVAQHQDYTHKIGKGCFNAFAEYKDLAMFFDDLGSVYPPPKDEKDTTSDLMSVFHSLAVNVRSHADEVDQDRFRELVQAAIAGAELPNGP